MERLKERLILTKKALFALDEALKLPYSKIIRDASIQRFEFTLCREIGVKYQHRTN